MDPRGGTQPLWVHPREKAVGGGHQSQMGLWLLPTGMAGTWSQGMLQRWTHCPQGGVEELLPNSEVRAKVPLLEQEPE